MLRKRGFTLIELLVVISIIALLIGILLPALGAARRTARQMQNSTQIRGIQQACVTFAQNNREEYPGLNGEGQLVANGGQTSLSGNGGLVQARMAILLNQAYFTGDYASSPAETGKQNWTSGVVGTLNYSYAMLRLTDDDTAAPNAPTANLGRRSEWKDTINTEAIVVSDRAKGADANTVYSVHVKKPSSDKDWRGSVAHNDNSVTFESDEIVDNTRYGAGVLNTTDNLFVDETSGSGVGYNGLMIYTGIGTIFSGD